jgi:hypothetical protein
VNLPHLHRKGLRDDAVEDRRSCGRIEDSIIDRGAARRAFSHVGKIIQGQFSGFGLQL